MLKPFRFLVFLLLLPLLALPAAAQSDPRDLINELSQGKLRQRIAQVEAIAATGNSDVVPALQALKDGDLYFKKSDKTVYITRKSGRDLALLDPITGEEIEVVASGAVEKIKVNNSLRRLIDKAVGGLTLMSKDPSVRISAAETIFESGDPESLELLDEAIAAEQDPTVRKKMDLARAAVILNTDASDETKIEAVDLVAENGGRNVLNLLKGVTFNASPAVAEAANKAVEQIERTLVLWDYGQTIWYGVSLGSVLLLAAIGLAVTFGVMGVINMAHGEMVMLGAYTTFVVQEIIRNSFPELFNYSLLIALPLAFAVSGGCGLILERGVIRFLYGRPLETLLATWGVSLILQQGVRTIFGPTNKEVGNPDWMSGAYEIGGLVITANRLWIVVFSLFVFAALFVVLKKTPFGLQMRAVTQNRKMASSMGIRTPWVDAFTFALGSGIAGIAGVALSQISNVSPNLGQSYIIDSFMVVVFGGVGNLWGTLIGAMTLGVANKFLEPFAGAVLAKILILVFIILFIQKRPRGLFALKGRAVEA
ncbi:urea ABC transporter permease subunit UrtB [Hoeflea sp. WL0058]|uniref:Urea ABC transporter permease subunit UrtB n=1 Tax=Flavimaribacter sediminis TaxID=2865987 RepID=A0AAE3D2M2_9HYPH|nr:urea ABC transporter permease subunit UrtB [Flavimaribacter sediminis]MBW8639277.1 urea ABC transporter permease subunit UrtB [Flavimaribacter sediminis]